MLRLRKVLAILLALTLFLPLTSSAARRSEPEELDRLIKKINERQSKNLKEFEKKAKAYFFDTQKPETTEILIKEFPPGEAVTVIVLSNLSKRSYKDIVAMKKAGKGWQDITGQINVKLKDVVKEVKDFRLGIG
ncbi:MAG: hypothetical protein HZA07_02995 [Nitrospirae bacterium]|nr:hypothetical protein [Nitrospirota bacterium]